jgi:hypothetical protein
MTDIDDSDLPEILWPGGKAPEPRPLDKYREAAAKVEAHYPAILEQKRQRKIDRVIKRDREDSAKERGGPCYIKRARKIQMYTWLMHLRNTFPAMDYRERNFCETLLAKFQKYTPYGVKWITRKQFDWLKNISVRYIHIP